MKIAKSDFTLTDNLEANLHGLSDKHARQMREMVTGSVKKLAKNFARLLAKEQRARDKQQRKDTRKSVQNLVLKLNQLLAQPSAQAA
jgi:hypothetical protein